MAIPIAKRMYLTGPGSETGVLGGDSNICIMTAFMCPRGIILENNDWLSIKAVFLQNV